VRAQNLHPFVRVHTRTHTSSYTNTRTCAFAHGSALAPSPRMFGPQTHAPARTHAPSLRYFSCVPRQTRPRLASTNPQPVDAHPAQQRFGGRRYTVPLAVGQTYSNTAIPPTAYSLVHCIAIERASELVYPPRFFPFIFPSPFIDPRCVSWGGSVSQLSICPRPKGRFLPKH